MQDRSESVRLMHMSFTLRHRMLRSTARLADALLPGPCILCGDDATDTGWCAPCWSDIPGRGDARCPVCALPRPGEGTCGRCLSRPPQFTATFAAAGYGFPLDAIVSHFKYGRNLTLAAPLGALLCAGLAHAPRPDLLVPVPAARARLVERGFNQAAELARIVAREFDLKFDATIARRRDDDPPQASLSLDARVRNVRGAFRCTRALDGARIAIVDDVMTSGATLNALARTLLEAGAGEVHCWVVARTPEPG